MAATTVPESGHTRHRYKTEAIARILDVAAVANSIKPDLSRPDGAAAVFVCVRPPLVSIKELMNKVLGGRETVWVLSFILVERLTTKTGIAVTQLNMHRLLLTAFAIANKMTYDLLRTNRSICDAVGMPYTDLFTMERMFLKMLEWDVFVTGEEVRAVKSALPNIEASVAYAAEVADASQLPIPLMPEMKKTPQGDKALHSLQPGCKRRHSKQVEALWLPESASHSTRVRSVGDVTLARQAGVQQKELLSVPRPPPRDSESHFQRQANSSLNSSGWSAASGPLLAVHLSDILSESAFGELMNNIQDANTSDARP
eukprot:Hpha_TRINITY_DN16312_c0_g1::TRINITY_DN16312_c0_g1_i1::g.59586::m.59586